MQGSVYRALTQTFPCLRWQGPSAGSMAALLTARGVKTTTGIVGLPVDEDAREHYRQKLNDVLEALKAIPADAAYRVSVEQTVQHKLKNLDSGASDEELEGLFGFQLEQGMKLCEEELKLIPKMTEWAPWDVPDGYTVELVEETEVEQKVAAGGPPPPPPPPPPKS